MWHVHGSWTTSLVQGRHEILLPVDAQRGPDGRGRARTWEWPAHVHEVPVERLRHEAFDVVLLQRPHELRLCRSWTGREPGLDVPAFYVEHNTPGGAAATTRHPLAEQRRIPVVHVTGFNQLMWDSGRAPTTVVEHGVVDPGYRYTGADPTLASVVNEPVRRGRVVGTDLLLRVAARRPVAVYGMGVSALAETAASMGITGWGSRLHDDLPQHELLQRLPRHRAYLHVCRWTSLGLSLIEAMLLGMPVLAVDSTEASAAIPAGAGLVSTDLDALLERADHWQDHPDDAREAGLVARRHALERYGLARFLDDWDQLLEGAISCGSR
nr:glycosyltransferase [Flexivirga aerilata]